MGIEKYQTSKQLFGYQWGQMEQISLFGVFRLRWVSFVKVWTTHNLFGQITVAEVVHYVQTNVRPPT